MTMGINITGARGSASILGQGLFVASDTAIHEIGDKVEVAGRTYRYCKAVADIIAGTVVSSDVSLGCGLLADGSLTAAIAAGDTSFSVTHATQLDGITKDMLKGGTVVLTDSASLDRAYIIKSNTAMASDIVTITIEGDDALIAFADATTGVSIYANPWMSVRPAAIGTDEFPCGIAQIPIAYATAPYFWVQTHGLGGAIVTDTGTGGQDLMLTGTGQLIIATAGYPVVAKGVLDVTTTLDMGMVFIQIE